MAFVAHGKEVFSSPAPLAWDSSAAGAGVAGPGAGGKAAPVRAAYKARSVRLGMPAGFEGRKFPVYLDPSYSASPTSTDYGEIQSAFPNTEELDSTSDGKVTVGFVSGIDRGFYVFGMPSALVAATTHVLSATFTGKVVAAAAPRPRRTR